MIINPNFRYFGDTTKAVSSTSGYITVATHLDREAETVFVGLSFTPPGVRFDKGFSRMIAQFRLMTSLASTSEELVQASEELRLGLLSVRDRVRKTYVRRRLSDAEYAFRRDAKQASLEDKASDSNHLNVGYYDYVIEHFEVSDFSNDSIIKYAFSVHVASDASHDEIDASILEHISTEGYHPAWVYSLIVDLTGDVDIEDEFEDTDEDEDEDGEDSDVDEAEDTEEDTEEVTIADVNAGFDNPVVVVASDKIYVTSTEYQELEYSLTPVFDTKDELLAWIDELRALVARS